MFEHHVSSEVDVAQHWIIALKLRVARGDRYASLAITAKTRLWALLYARVQQADGRAWRNVLIQRYPRQPPPVDPFQHRALILSALPMQAARQYAEGMFAIDEVHASLRLYGLADDTPLTAMAVEFFTAPEVSDPLGRELGAARTLRMLPLVPIPDAC